MRLRLRLRALERKRAATQAPTACPSCGASVCPSCGKPLAREPFYVPFPAYPAAYPAFPTWQPWPFGPTVINSTNGTNGTNATPIAPEDYQIRATAGLGRGL